MNSLAIVQETNTSQDELTLLNAVLNGNSSASRQFVSRYTSVIESRVRKIFRNCHWNCGEDDVDDMINEIWVSLFENNMRPLRRFDPSRNIKVATWIGLLARNRTIDRLRKHRGYEVSIDDIALKHEPPAESFLPADELEQKEDVGLFIQAMRFLSHEEQSFLKDWYLDDRDPEDLAKKFGIAVGTVYSRRFKIQAKLARSIKRLNKLSNTTPPQTPPQQMVN